MSRKINYKKSKENDWIFSSKIENYPTCLYYMSSGRYTFDPLNSKGRIKARTEIFFQPTVMFNNTSHFYCKEDIQDYLKKNKNYLVLETKETYVDLYFTNKDTILSNLPTRDEVLIEIPKIFKFSSDDQELFNRLLKLNNNNLSHTCEDYCDEKGIFHPKCIEISGFHPISFKRTKNN